jgi:hypothetical protein
MIRDLTPYRTALVVVIVLGPVIALLAAVPQGYTPPIWLVLLVIAASLGFAFAPELQTGSLVMVLVIAWWAIKVDHDLPISVIGAAAALLASHLAAMLAGYGPRDLPFDADLVRLWVRRGVLIWLVSPLTWLVTNAYDGQSAPSSIWVAGLAAVLGVAIAAGLTFPTRLDRVGHGGG